MESVPEITALQTQDNVRIANELAAALRLIQRMAGGEIHAPHLIYDGSLQCLCQVNETRQAHRGASCSISDDYWILGRGQQASRLGNRPGVSLRRRRQSKLR